jgi:hypothetical protein
MCLIALSLNFHTSSSFICTMSDTFDSRALLKIEIFADDSIPDHGI